jgi:SAM-dependent methyltransferase
MDDRENARHWEANADEWVRLVRAGYDLARDHVNNPSFFALLPDVRGLDGLDVGCGDGHNTRLVAERGGRMFAMTRPSDAGGAGDEASVRAFVASSRAEWRVARCPAELVELLRAHDRHVVTVDGRDGLLIAYHSWSPVARADEARVFVLFRHIAGHPRAPAALQQSSDRLTFARDEG